MPPRTAILTRTGPTCPVRVGRRFEVVRYTGAVCGTSPSVGPAFSRSMSYAIIHVGGKQYRVREGERLLVDRLQDRQGRRSIPAFCRRRQRQSAARTWCRRSTDCPMRMSHVARATHASQSARRRAPFSSTGPDSGFAVAADEQNAGIERLPLVGLEAVHQQPLASRTRVLLARRG